MRVIATLYLILLAGGIALFVLVDRNGLK